MSKQKDSKGKELRNEKIEGLLDKNENDNELKKQQLPKVGKMVFDRTKKDIPLDKKDNFLNKINSKKDSNKTGNSTNAKDEPTEKMVTKKVSKDDTTKNEDNKSKNDEPQIKNKLIAEVERIAEASDKEAEALTNIASTSKDSLGPSTSKIESDRIFSMTAESSMQNKLQEDIKNAQSDKGKYDSGKTSVGFNLEGDFYFPVYNDTTKITTKIPQLIKLYDVKYSSNATFTPNSAVRTPYFAEYPIVNNSREMFRMGTQIVRARLDSQNLLYNIKHDPWEQMKSSETLFANVKIPRHTGTEPEWTSNQPTNIQHVMTYIFAFLPIVATCAREIVQLGETSKSMLEMGNLDKISYKDYLRNVLASSKLPDDMPPHVAFGGIDHQLEWFEKEVEKLVESNLSEYKFGQGIVLSEYNNQTYRELEMHLPIDQWTAALLNIHRQRRNAYKQMPSVRQAWLQALSMEGTIVDLPTHIVHEDYEVPDITSIDTDSFLFTFGISKSFRNACLREISEYLNSFNLIKSKSVNESMKLMHGQGAGVLRETMIGHLQEKLEEVDTARFCWLIVLDIMAAFRPVKYDYVVMRTASLSSIPDLLMLLVCIFMFPNIFAQNKHIIGFCICNYLHKIRHKGYLKFEKRHGFAKNKMIPKQITEDEYAQGVIPYIFDESKTFSEDSVVSQIRSLMKVSGEIYTLDFQAYVNVPRFEESATYYIPYERIQRDFGLDETPFYNAMCVVVDIVTKVTEDVLQAEMQPRRNASDMLIWLKNVMVTFEEFSNMIHYEGNELYRLAMRHWACVWSDIKSPSDYNKTQKPVFGIKSNANDIKQPFTVRPIPIRIKYTDPLSCVLTIQGIYATLGEYKLDDQFIQVPDVGDLYNKFFSIAKGCSKFTEVLEISKYILSTDAPGLLGRLHAFSELASRRVTYKQVVKLISKSLSELPPDFFSYIERDIDMYNKMQYWDPRYMMLDYWHKPIIGPTPSVVGRTLQFADAYLHQEISIATKLLFSENGFLFHIAKGVTIQMQKEDDLTPMNQPTMRKCFEYRVTARRTKIITPIPEGGVLIPGIIINRCVNGKMEQTVYTDLSPKNAPNIHFICERPRQIDSKYRHIIKSLILSGNWSFEFTEFWYQPFVMYTYEVPQNHYSTEIDKILETVDDTMPLIVFPDTCKRQRVLGGTLGEVQYQYLYTTNNLTGDIVARDIDGSRQDTRVYMQLDPDNWRLGVDGVSSDPLLESSADQIVSKLDMGKPNMLNTIAVEKEGAFRRDYKIGGDDGFLIYPPTELMII